MVLSSEFSPVAQATIVVFRKRVSVSAQPPNMALQRTWRIVTRFAYANPAPMRQAAELGC